MIITQSLFGQALAQPRPWMDAKHAEEKNHSRNFLSLIRLSFVRMYRLVVNYLLHFQAGSMDERKIQSSQSRARFCFRVSFKRSLLIRFHNRISSKQSREASRVERTRRRRIKINDYWAMMGTIIAYFIARVIKTEQ